MCVNVGKKVKEMKKKESTAAATTAGSQKAKGNIGEFYYSRALLCFPLLCLALPCCMRFRFDSRLGLCHPSISLRSTSGMFNSTMQSITSTDSVKKYAIMF